MVVLQTVCKSTNLWTYTLIGLKSKHVKKNEETDSCLWHLTLYHYLYNIWKILITHYVWAVRLIWAFLDLIIRCLIWSMVVRTSLDLVSLILDILHREGLERVWEISCIDIVVGWCVSPSPFIAVYNWNHLKYTTFFFSLNNYMTKFLFLNRGYSRD